MSHPVEQLRNTAKRLERYAVKVRGNLWSGDRDQAIRALADVAETAEIAPGSTSWSQSISTTPRRAQTHRLKARAVPDACVYNLEEMDLRSRDQTPAAIAPRNGKGASLTRRSLPDPCSVARQPLYTNAF